MYCLGDRYSVPLPPGGFCFAATVGSLPGQILPRRSFRGQNVSPHAPALLVTRTAARSGTAAYWLYGKLHAAHDCYSPISSILVLLLVAALAAQTINDDARPSHHHQGGRWLGSTGTIKLRPRRRCEPRAPGEQPAPIISTPHGRCIVKSRMEPTAMGNDGCAACATAGSAPHSFKPRQWCYHRVW